MTNITDIREKQIEREMERDEREFAEAMDRAREVVERQWRAS